ncbi:MAG: hypothetical protein AB1513_05650 [Pseudomonadota bacterium]
MKARIALLALAAIASAAHAAPQQTADTIILAANEYPNKGKVLEVIDTEMYTYLQVTGSNGPVWLAASRAKIDKGANISYPNGAVMSNFHSKSLNRTFDTIIFIDKVAPAK